MEIWKRDCMCFIRFFRWERQGRIPLECLTYMAIQTTPKFCPSCWTILSSILHWSSLTSVTQPLWTVTHFSLIIMDCVWSWVSRDSWCYCVITKQGSSYFFSLSPMQRRTRDCLLHFMRQIMVSIRYPTAAEWLLHPKIKPLSQHLVLLCVFWDSCENCIIRLAPYLRPLCDYVLWRKKLRYDEE